MEPEPADDASARPANKTKFKRALSLSGLNPLYRGSSGRCAWKGRSKSLLPREKGGPKGGDESDGYAGEWDPAAPDPATEDSRSKDGDAIDPAVDQPDDPELAWLTIECDSRDDGDADGPSISRNGSPMSRLFKRRGSMGSDGAKPSGPRSAPPGGSRNTPSDPGLEEDGALVERGSFC